MRITTVQRKHLADIIKSIGLKVSDFATSSHESKFIVKYKYDYFSFEVNKLNVGDDYKISFYPVDNTAGRTAVGKWVMVAEHFKKWAHELYNEINTPTGWESFDSDNFLNIEYSDLNETFTDNDKIIIRNNLKELADKISALQLGEKATSLFEAKIDEMSKQLDAMNKFDWKSFFIGNVANIIITLALPSEVSGSIWYLIKSIFVGLRLPY